LNTAPDIPDPDDAASSRDRAINRALIRNEAAQLRDTAIRLYLHILRIQSLLGSKRSLDAGFEDLVVYILFGTRFPRARRAAERHRERHPEENDGEPQTRRRIYEP